MENFVIIKDPNRGICNANIELILACNEAKKKKKEKKYKDLSCRYD